jgi:hypothetical protein
MMTRAEQSKAREHKEEERKGCLLREYRHLGLRLDMADTAVAQATSHVSNRL